MDQANVYVSCHRADLARDVAAQIRAAGHNVVSTWHDETDPRPANEDGAAWRIKADRNLEQIETADTLVLVASPEHIDGSARVPGGKFFEAGYAHGLKTDDGDSCCRVIVLGGAENGMLHTSGVSHAADVDQVTALLAKGGA